MMNDVHTIQADADGPAIDTVLPSLNQFSQVVLRNARIHPNPQDMCERLADASDSGAEAALFGEVARWPESLIPLYSYRLNSTQLNLLFLVFLEPADPSLQERVVKILSSRMKSHLCRMVWRLLQSQPANIPLQSLLEQVSDQVKKLPFLSFFRKQPPQNSTTLIDRIFNIMTEDSKAPDLDAFFTLYDIDPDGNIAQEVQARFFSICGVEGIAKNQNAFTRMFRPLCPTDLLYSDPIDYMKILSPLLENYLLILNPTEYDSGLMKLVLDAYGMPDNENHFWKEMGERVRTRYVQWTYLDHLRKDLHPSRNKIRVLSLFFELIENVVSDPDNTMLYVYFPRFVLLNLPGYPTTMLLYPRRLFSETYDRFSIAQQARHDEMSTDAKAPLVWPIDMDRWMSARTAILTPRVETDRRRNIADAVIRGEIEVIIELQFEDTPLLYARQFILDLLA